MNPINFLEIFQNFGFSPLVSGIIIVFILVWSLCWKGWALWISARGSQKIWFIAFLLVNTVGILEIIYIFFLHKKEESAGGVSETETTG